MLGDAAAEPGDKVMAKTAFISHLLDDLHDPVCLREQIEDFAHTGTQILIEGNLTNEAEQEISLKPGNRGLLFMVISEGCPVAYR
jgi:hypothetical protein